MPAQSSSAARKTTAKAAPKRVAPPARVRLTVAHERAVYATFAALLVTGAGWLVCHYLLSPGGELARPHPLEGLWLELHGAAGMLALVLFGSLFTAHMTKAWALGRGRASGATLAGLFALLAATGYGLYYVANDDARSWIGVIHWVVGLGIPVLLVAHVWMLRTQLRRVRPD